MRIVSTTVYLSSSPNVDEIWKFQDSHRQAQAGDVLRIKALQSETRRKLNGQEGRVAKVDKDDSSRLGVALNKISIRSNRSNAATSKHLEASVEPTSCLFNDLSHVNHASADSANVSVEISINHIRHEKPEVRLELLQIKNKFTCQCPMNLT
jgi:hypothetical protein